jgi:hypothetical protein
VGIEDELTSGTEESSIKLFVSYLLTFYVVANPSPRMQFVLLYVTHAAFCVKVYKGRLPVKLKLLCLGALMVGILLLQPIGANNVNADATDTDEPPDNVTHEYPPDPITELPQAATPQPTIAVPLKSPTVPPPAVQATAR